MSKPFFQFSFGIDKISPLTFVDPITIYQAKTIGDVIPILHKVEKAVEQGYYAAGFLAYEAAPAFDASYQVFQADHAFPFVYFAIFEKPSSLKDYASKQSYYLSDWEFRSNYDSYQVGIKNVKQAIERGDTYQINYTTHMEAEFSGDPYKFYQQLKQNQQANYSAYFSFDNYHVLSASPELFFHVKNGKITTKPMKGTAARGLWYEQDQQLKQTLYDSEKERAENLMIVDLLRNDVGKIATLGSVKVEKLLEVETYPTVHQMTSTVTANIKQGIGLVDWFQALFPCGSITGAPKVKTMEYIASFEQSPRGIYCGAIGYITPNQEAIFNVPIRTVVIDQARQQATYGVGSGITWDSSVKNEFKELQTKAKLLTEKRPSFELLETMLLTEGNFFIASYHMKRLANSAAYFNSPFSQKKVQSALAEVKQTRQTGNYKVRLLLDKQGMVHTHVDPLTPSPSSVVCALAKQPIVQENIFHYHKTTNRLIYHVHETHEPSIFSTLLWNDKEEITEFTTGNVVVEYNNKFYTPPIACGVLPGTYREYLLDQGIIEEKIIRKHELTSATNIWFINGVRGWIRVKIVGLC